jgi:hypothetical protein
MFIVTAILILEISPVKSMFRSVCRTLKIEESGFFDLLNHKIRCFGDPRRSKRSHLGKAFSQNENCCYCQNSLASVCHFGEGIGKMLELF